MALANLEKYDQAIEAYNKAIVISPKYIGHGIIKAWLYLIRINIMKLLTHLTRPSN